MSNPYCYPGTSVLRNKFDIRDPEQLKAAETREVISGLLRLEEKPLALQFSADRLKATHKALFGKLYDFAGAYRENMPRMSKERADGSVISYGPSVNVQPYLADVFQKLDRENGLRGLPASAFAAKAAFYYSELDAAHPFPDGNSRTIRKFMQDLAQSAGHDLDWDRVSQTEQQRNALYHARDEAIRGKYAELEAIMLAALEPGKGLEKFQRTPDQQQQTRSGPEGTPAGKPDALPAIRRNSYPEADRQQAQERIAAAIESDPEPFFEAYNQRPDSHGGRYICSDLFKETFPEFAASNDGRSRYNNPLHNSAAVLAAAQLTRAIEDQTHPDRDTVVFLTGVPGAGKTSAVTKGRELEPNIRAIFEGQLASPQASIAKIQAVIDAGLKPAILVVHATPEFALQNTLSRFEREGRGASIHAMSTIQSQLPAGLAAIRDTFGDKVQFDIFDRTAGLNQTVKLSGWDNLPIVEKEGSYASIRERLTTALDQHHAAGTISEDGYRQAVGRATLARPREAVHEDAGRTQQLPQRGLIADPVPQVERRGALRFWQEQTAAGETIKHAAGRLNVPGDEPFPRDLSAQRAVSRGTGYHAGHLIGHQFGGPEIPGNLSLQNHEMNQGGGTYYNQESSWADTLKEGTAVAIHVKEITRADNPAFLYRSVESVTTTPAGQVSRDSIAFLNPESERVRTATGKTLEQLDTPAQVYHLAPERLQSSPPITARLNDTDVTHLLEAKHGEDQRGRAQELLTILKGTETVAALDGRAQLGYDPDRELFYATLRAADKPLLDDQLKELQQKAVERDQQRHRPRERDTSHERD